MQLAVFVVPCILTSFLLLSPHRVLFQEQFLSRMKVWVFFFLRIFLHATEVQVFIIITIVKMESVIIKVRCLMDEP